MMYAIETYNLTKQYGDKIAVNHISLKVSSGEIFGFLGRNGAGKSTFINMLTGISLPSQGEFKLLGKPMSQKQRKQIGVLPDYSTFYNHMTALQHLRYFSKVQGIKLSIEEASTFLKKVGLLGSQHQKVKNFSFGMKKKLGIAQAICSNPTLIFLDEPTSGVDMESALSIHALIKELQAEGKTIFMTSHNLHEVEKLCTRIAIMKDGEIVTEGTMEDLRSQHQKKKRVVIKHDPYPTNQSKSIKQLFRTLSPKFECGHTETTVMLTSRKNIPFLIRELTQLDVNLYKVEVEEPSLENIFLQENTSPTLHVNN